MQRINLTAALLLFLAACGGGGEAQSPGAALLFAGGTGGLTPAEQQLILDNSGLVLDSTGTALVDYSCGLPVGAAVEFSDWNGDGNQEVLVIAGNTCTSGMAGSSVFLFIKDSTGTYLPSLGFPASSATPESTANLGYPDLLIGGPGFCFPVWRWDGTAYQFLKQVSQAPDGCNYPPGG